MWVQCEAPVNDSQVGEHNSNFTMVYGTQITIATGAYKATYNWGASHCIYIYIHVYTESIEPIEPIESIESS